MDKLEPVLKQKFWILLGIGVIMTFVGWWMATGSLAATITQRKTTLDGVEKVIPSGETPNGSWAEGLARINAEQQKLVDEAKREMWNRQKAEMFWPPTVDEIAQQVPYQGEFPAIATILYRDNYILDAEKVWKRAGPFNPIDQTGTVLFPPERFPKTGDPNLTPNSKEMWERQEDLWVLVPIVDAIRTLNGGEDGTRQDAVIHVVEKLLLMGGDKEKLNAVATGGGSGSMGGMDGTMGAMGSAMGSMGSSSDMSGLNLSALGGMGGGTMGGAAGGAGGLALPTSADFDPKEEYGDGGGAGTGGGGMAGYAAMMSMASDAGGSAGGDTGGGVSTVAGPRRYVDDAESLPYKTRAFYLSVIMDHRKIPMLLGELTANENSAWPIEIGRVQVVRLNPDEGIGTGPGGGIASGGYGGGGASQYAGGSNSYPGSGGFGGSNEFSGAPGGFPSPSSGFPNAGADNFATTDGSDGSALAEGFGAAGSGMGNRGRGAYASFDAAFTDPFLARVALCGLIYIYKEVKEPEAVAPTEASPTQAEPVAEGAMPTEPPVPVEPGDVPAAEPNVPQPAATEPAAAAPAPAANNSPAANPPATPTSP